MVLVVTMAMVDVFPLSVDGVIDGIEDGIVDGILGSLETIVILPSESKAVWRNNEASSRIS